MWPVWPTHGASLQSQGDIAGIHLSGPFMVAIPCALAHLNPPHPQTPPPPSISHFWLCHCVWVTHGHWGSGETRRGGGGGERRTARMRASQIERGGRGGRALAGGQLGWEGEDNRRGGGKKGRGRGVKNETRRCAVIRRSGGKKRLIPLTRRV